MQLHADTPFRPPAVLRLSRLSARQCSMARLLHLTERNNASSWDSRPRGGVHPQNEGPVGVPSASGPIRPNFAAPENSLLRLDTTLTPLVLVATSASQ